MLTSAAQQTALKNHAGWLRKIEIFLLTPFLLYGLGVLYEQVFCISESACDLPVVDGDVSVIVIQLFYMLWPLVCLRLIWANFVLFDQDPRSDKWFGRALTILGVGYVGMGLFWQTIVETGALGEAQYLYFILLLCFLVSAGLLLRQTYSWEGSAWFIKARLSVLLLLYILTIIYPEASLIGAFLITGPLLLIPFDPRRETLNIVPADEEPAKKISVKK